MTQDKQNWLMQMVRAAWPEGLRGRNVTIWGVTEETNDFTTNDVAFTTNDVATFVEWLVDQQANIAVYDDNAPAGLPSEVAVVAHPHDSLQTTDLLIVLTGWEGYENCEAGALRWFVRTPIAIDLPGRFEVQQMSNGGFVLASSPFNALEKNYSNVPAPHAKGYWEQRELTAC